MKQNDPGRRAILATLLLHDLAATNSTLGDSFVVLPFARDWKWADPAAPPPTGNGASVRAESGREAEFVRQLKGLAYEAQSTYFYPGVLAALDELEAIGAAATDVRAIVLVTDGVPEPTTRDAELRRIETELAPRLERSRIRLYVLAFGTEADAHRDFFERMTRTGSPAPFGLVLFDPQGQDLLGHMLEIFSAGFGYSVGSLGRLPGISALDLEGGITAQRVAVVVSDTATTVPVLRLTPPTGGAVNAPEVPRSAAVSGGSYTLLWVYSPNPGNYGFDTDAVGGSVAVLRPVRLALKIRAVPPRQQIDRVIAHTSVPLEVLVQNQTAKAGDPGPVELSFRTLGDQVQGPTGVPEYGWRSDLAAPPFGPGKVVKEGRVYEIATEFREHPKHRDQPYIGYVEVEARRGEALVGTTTNRVEVHPFLAIMPRPATSYAGDEGQAPRALGRNEEACTRFDLELTSGHLPHPDRPKYAIRATVTSSDPAVFDRELRLAVFTLDSLSLQPEGRPGEQPGKWYQGQELSGAELLGSHRLCVRLGKPTVGDPAKPVELAARFTLVEDPYDDFGVVSPHTLKVLVAPPTFLQLWQGRLIGLALVLGSLALLWYSRARPTLPRDLGVALSREGTGIPLARRELAHGTRLAKVLGLADEALIEDGDFRLARVRPSAENLFSLRPARGVRVETLGGEALPLSRGLAALSVHRVYRLRSARGSYLVRLEYR